MDQVGSMDADGVACKGGEREMLDRVGDGVVESLDTHDSCRMCLVCSSVGEPIRRTWWLRRERRGAHVDASTPRGFQRTSMFEMDVLSIHGSTGLYDSGGTPRCFVSSVYHDERRNLKISVRNVVACIDDC